MTQEQQQVLYDQIVERLRLEGWSRIDACTQAYMTVRDMVKNGKSLKGS